MLITFAQLCILSVFLFKRLNTFLIGFTKIKEVCTLLIRERKLFATYYYNTGIKKLNSNIIILLFQPLVSKEILGLFALLMKVHLFIFGMVRTLESVMINRISKEKFDLSFLKNAPYIALFVQVSYLITGLVYMKYISDSYYFTLTLVLSFLVFPFVWFIRSRANFLSSYKNLHLNISYSLFLGIILMGYVLSRFMGYHIELNGIVYLFAIGSLIQMLYLIYKERRIFRFNQVD